MFEGDWDPFWQMVFLLFIWAPLLLTWFFAMLDLFLRPNNTRPSSERTMKSIETRGVARTTVANVSGGKRSPA